MVVEKASFFSSSLWLIFLRQIAQQLHFNEVFEHIGVTADMEGVAITQHGLE